MLIKNKIDSSNFLKVGEDYTQIAAGANSITSTKDSGNYILGPVSISSSINNIKVGNIFRFNPMLSTGIPSTMVTPMPVLKIDLPIKNIGQLSAIAAIAQSIL